MSSESGVWDDAVANSLLSAHDYRSLDALIREHVDKLRSPEAVDWLFHKAYDGDVIVIYHLIRNLAKCSVPAAAATHSSGSSGAASLGLIRVLSGDEFRACFQWYLFLLLRIAQDMLSLSVIQGTTPSAALFAAFRDKIGGWLRNQFPESRWPALGNVAEMVRRGMVCCSDVTLLPLPVWVLTCSRSFASSYFNIGSALYFENPTTALIDACKRTISPLNVERERIRNAFFTLVREITWQGLAGLNVSAFITPPAYSPYPASSSALTLAIVDGYATITTTTTPTPATPAIATPAIATPAIATPAIATPAIATPAIATPAIATTNISLTGSGSGSGGGGLMGQAKEAADETEEQEQPSVESETCQVPKSGSPAPTQVATAAPQPVYSSKKHKHRDSSRESGRHG
jgi:hypothetical protein